MTTTREGTTEPWTHGETIANGVRLHYVEAGDPDDPLVLLLHGFPEFWYAWRHQLPALAEAGYHVIAPDLRGYNTSEKPPGVEAYRLTHLVGDVMGLIEEFGAEKAGSEESDEAQLPLLVGHDWGGAIAWEVAIRHPEAIERLAILNAPHPERFQRELGSASQLRKSWYMFFFQLPGVPERAIRAGNYRVLDRLLREDPVDPDAFDSVDIERYTEALSKPGALTAAINYYRALARENPIGTLRRALVGQSGRPPAYRRVQVPTLLIWGEQDSALSVSLTEGLDGWVEDLSVERLPEASHWVQADAPETVNDLLVDFLAEE
ncbi:epoxide hydrolase [Halobacteriales archaeon QS_3_64_16]|nr:MAG: epoxide hydrolase [Halobacteriales archaeon QS_3_64_16]